jgi:hypothetical protein
LPNANRSLIEENEPPVGYPACSATHSLRQN